MGGSGMHVSQQPMNILEITDINIMFYEYPKKY